MTTNTATATAPRYVQEGDYRAARYARNYRAARYARKAGSLALTFHVVTVNHVALCRATIDLDMTTGRDFESVTRAHYATRCKACDRKMDKARAAFEQAQKNAPAPAGILTDAATLDAATDRLCDAINADEAPEALAIECAMGCGRTFAHVDADLVAHQDACTGRPVEWRDGDRVFTSRDFEHRGKCAGRISNPAVAELVAYAAEFTARYLVAASFGDIPRALAAVDVAEQGSPRHPNPVKAAMDAAQYATQRSAIRAFRGTAELDNHRSSGSISSVRERREQAHAEALSMNASHDAHALCDAVEARHNLPSTRRWEFPAIEADMAATAGRTEGPANAAPRFPVVGDTILVRQAEDDRRRVALVIEMHTATQATQVRATFTVRFVDDGAVDVVAVDEVVGNYGRIHGAARPQAPAYALGAHVRTAVATGEVVDVVVCGWDARRGHRVTNRMWGGHVDVWVADALALELHRSSDLLRA